MNFQGGFSIQQPEEIHLGSSWMPVTPEKPPILARSNSVPDNPNGSQALGMANWLEPATNYNCLAQIFNANPQVGRMPERFGYDGNPNTNGIAGSYEEQSLLVGGEDWNNIPFMQLLQQGGDSDFVTTNRTLTRDVQLAAERPLVPISPTETSNFLGDCSSSGGFSSGSSFRPEIANAHCQVGNSWIGSGPSLLLRQGTQYSASDMLDNGNIIPKKIQYYFPTTLRPNYDLNSSSSINPSALTNVSNSLVFTPVTPDQASNKEKQRSTMFTSSVPKSSSHEKDGMGNLVQYMGEEAIQQHGSELLQNIVESSSTVVCTSHEEKTGSDKKVDLGIDLNKTPQQKPPKRKKHRPKVIVEGKPKRPRKPAVPKDTVSKENRPKRKYVRKNVPKDLTAQEADVTGETREPDNGTTQKTCKRVLDFDLEKTSDEIQANVVGQQEVQTMNKSTTSTTGDYQAMRPRNGTNHTWGTMPSTQNGLPKGLMAENQIPGKTSGTHFTSQMTPDRQAAVAPLASTKDGQMKNLYVTGRHELNANAHQWQNRAADKCTPMQQQTQGDGTGQEILQGKAHNGNLERAKRMLQLERIKLMMQILPQQAPRTPSKFYEARGSKREHSQTTGDNHSTANHMGSSLYGKILQVDESHRNGHPLHAAFFQTHKKKKIGDDYRDSPNLPSNVKAADGGLGKERTHDANPTGQKSRMNSAILYSHIESSRLTDRGNDQVNNVTSDRYIHPMALGQNSPKQQISSQIHSHTRRMGSTMGLNPINSFPTQTTIARYNHLIHIPSVPEISTGPGNGQIFQTCYNSMSEKRQTMGAPLLKLASSGVNKPQELSAKRRGTKKKQVPTLVDEITYRLQNLDLNRSGNGLPMQDQNALVLYKADGAIVPYDGLEFLKKRKPRPKVDLDPETNRIWNLLMGKEGSEDLEGTNKDKEKWWEEERKVFRGRVDSFIARMHLVQGDRRFSPWKGSVVDSVIGVFLTQNVSDHLSSSAFMSLAARFPLKSSYNTQDKAEPDITDRQAPISILNLDDNIKWHEVSSQPINSRNITPHDAAENQWVRQTERSLTEARNQSLDEEFILSQDSFDSTITQVAGGIRSCSGSNSETEDPCTSCKHSNVQLSALTHYLQMEKTTSVQEVRGHVNGSTVSNEKSKHGLVEYDWLKSRSDAMKHLDFPSSAYSNNPDYLYMQPTGPSRSIKLHMMHNSGLPEVWYTETFSDESTSSWHSTASGSTKGPEAVSKNSKTGELTGNFGNSTKELNGERRSQAAPTTDSYPLLSTHLTNQQGIPQPVPHVGYNHQSFCSNYQHERNNMFHLEGTSSTEPVKLAEAHAKMQTANTENVTKFSRLREKTFEGGDSISTVSVQTHKENRLAEPNLKEQPSSHHASDAANTKISKVKKGNTENQKKNEVNWDNLRKHVESNGGKRQRGKDSMDSLDYETLRNANVNEISNAIKERGMNNMLAERIKEFLNRLVREHGSIDLEWLRDVPPDKAKDYLLSIRGLGLKSVECVRLLTLHHLAFPVDTNVGRIAVRLGWVPLQPLPESLQLHLLELYPMLESIQKYLWPRLCKLDQRTLYELHYQMITFGKVFCTKSKPNCNACPMRGECRHFASAFASARLALPGPEERGIVSSTVPIPTEEPPAVVIHPMALPPPGNDLVKEVGSRTGKCEPIIEEPATPEQECTEISQSDIEDAFYEDPDEIPTIKLNIEKFTENLQTYMEKSMDIQESDMSKALVALTPDVASIPIPKLKNVNRLRTEHQVYELPDSHPLLERLDRREPDDPSPYLLAIWTPGETANSIQPSERSCGSQEPGKFCNDETCFSCNSMREANSQTVRGTVLIPCRTAMRGSFPLNGTYFQVNEVFADHDSSLNPINVPREWLWNLQRRMVYFGTSVTSIFRGLSTEGIQYCFWKGFVCVRGFDMTTRAPRPLMARLHFPASKLARAKNDNKR